MKDDLPDPHVPSTDIVSGACVSRLRRNSPTAATYGSKPSESLSAARSAKLAPETVAETESPKNSSTAARTRSDNTVKFANVPANENAALRPAKTSWSGGVTPVTNTTLTRPNLLG